MYDYILANGTIFDGTGGAACRWDIGLKGDKIAAVGDLSGADAREKIDVRGLAVAPGFIDMHTHSDFTLLVNSAAENQVHQGVTLEAIGQCGHSCAPVADPAAFAKSIIGYHPGPEITWKSFDDYLSHLEKQSLGVNVVALVGHGAVYRAVKGEDSGPVTDDEIKAMVKLVEEALEQGAIGFSTGLEYWPGSISKPEEIVALCKTLPRYDALYATHVRNRDLYYDLGFGEALAVARLSGARLQISHIQPKFGAPVYAMEHTLDMICKANQRGQDAAFDVIPDVWSFTTMSSILPAWAFEGGVPKIVERLADDKLRQKLKQNPKPIWQLVKEKKWDRIALFRADRSPELIGMTFDAIGQKLGKDPHDAVFDILLKEGDNLYNATWTSQSFAEADVELCLRQPECAVISDNIALAPYGALKNTRWSPSSYGWTARLFEHYVKTKKVLTLSEAVRRITSLPAQRLGLKNRGMLKPGYAADITVFNPEGMIDKSTLKNPNVYPEGVVHVFVNGCLELRNGERTPENGGAVIRRGADSR